MQKRIKAKTNQKWWSVLWSFQNNTHTFNTHEHFNDDIVWQRSICNQSYLILWCLWPIKVISLFVWRHHKQLTWNNQGIFQTKLNISRAGPIFRCSLPTAMNISRSEILRKRKKERSWKTHGRSWEVNGRSCEVCGGHGRSVRGPERSVGGHGRSVSGPGRSLGG